MTHFLKAEGYGPVKKDLLKIIVAKRNRF